jgi:hypothetical protein
LAEATIHHGGLRSSGLYEVIGRHRGVRGFAKERWPALPHVRAKGCIIRDWAGIPIQSVEETDA